MKGDAHIARLSNGAGDPDSLVEFVEEMLLAMPGFLQRLAQARRVLVKPNLGGGSAVTMTSADMIVAVTRALRGHSPAAMIVGDSAVVGGRSERTIEALGLRERLEPLGIEVRDFDEGTFEDISVPLGKQISSVAVTREYLEADLLISLARLKTTNATKVSLTMKNLKGLIADPDKIQFHRRGVHGCLADLLTAVKPDLAMIDAIQGSDMGRPITVNALVAGTDAVAVDWTGCLLMGMDPGKVFHIRSATGREIGASPPPRVQEEARTLSVPFQGPANTASGIPAPDQVRIAAAGACSGCIGILTVVLDRMNDEGTLSSLPPMTIALGPHVKLASRPDCLVAMGLCSGARDDADYFLEGCPPQSRLEGQNTLESLGRRET